MKTAPALDVEAIARELGMTQKQVIAHLREAVAAGLLRVIDDGTGDSVILEAVLPDEEAR